MDVLGLMIVLGFVWAAATLGMFAGSYAVDGVKWAARRLWARRGR